MGKKSSPAPPQPVKIDPRETAEAQFEFGKKSALYNKQLAESTFQQTPYGSLRYEQLPGGTGEVPITRMIQELDPAEQALLDQQRVLKGQYGDIAGRLMGDTGELFSAPVEQTRQNQINSILERFQPQQLQDKSRLETQLANQGFVRGSQAWNSAMDEQNRRENDFRLAANLQGGGEMRADRNQQLQALSTFMTGSQPTMPQFAPMSSPQVATPDYAGLAATNAQMQNQANMAAYNAQMQSGGSGLGSLLGTAAGAVFGGPMGAAVGGSIGRGVGNLGGWSWG